MKKTILIARSNPVSPDPRVDKLARALFEVGHKVTVLGWDRTASLPRKREREFGTLELLPIRASFGRGLGNFPQLLRWQWGLLRWLLTNHSSVDVIHACDFDTILPSLLVGRLFRKKVVYDIFDFYADHLRNTPRWMKRLIRRVDLWAIGRADAVILADESRLLQIREAKPRHVTVIYNTPEDVHTAHQQARKQQNAGGMQQDSRRDAVELKNSFRIAYVGLLNIERGLLELLEVMGQHPTWSLDLAGFGGDEAIVVPKAISLPNVHFHGRISYPSALELMRRADVLIATYDPRIPNHRYASPNKLFEAMMLAKPIIVATGTNMDRIVEEDNCGLIVPYGEVNALERVLSSLASDANLRARLGIAGRRAYDGKYHWDIMRLRLVALYDKIETL